MLHLYSADKNTNDVDLLGWFEDTYGDTLAFVTFDGRIVEAPAGTPKHGRGFDDFLDNYRDPPCVD